MKCAKSYATLMLKSFAISGACIWVLQTQRNLQCDVSYLEGSNNAKATCSYEFWQEFQAVLLKFQVMPTGNTQLPI